ncbi:MAG: DUF192 domain-containing protein [Rhizobiaceae bacterium]|nr:DUF192 domain-containing protein [Rhizobiaceae bacterium]
MRQFGIVSTLRASAFSLALVMSVATQSLADSKAMILPVDPAPLIVETDKGDLPFKIEIADDASERSMGLMFRDYLPPDQGMLFIFEQTRQVGFWMKNTKLPLDLIFISENGTVKAIKRGEPMSEAPIAPDAPVRFVLELNAGTAAKRGIVSGARIHHPVIDAISRQSPN